MVVKLTLFCRPLGLLDWAVKPSQFTGGLENKGEFGACSCFVHVCTVFALSECVDG